MDKYAALISSFGKQVTASRKHLKMLSDSPALQSPEGYLKQRRNTLDLLQSRLLSAQTRALSLQKNRFIALTSKLDAMSPLKVLTRGYALAQDEKGHVLRSVGQVKAGDLVSVHLGDGVFRATVSEVKENHHESAESNI